MVKTIAALLACLFLIWAGLKRIDEIAASRQAITEQSRSKMELRDTHDADLARRIQTTKDIRNKLIVQSEPP